MRNNLSLFGELPEKNGEPDRFTQLHNNACILCAWHAFRWLIACILGIVDALQSVSKYEDICGPRPFNYYLIDNGFWVYVVIFLSAAAELLIYIVRCQLTEKKKSVLLSSMYFFSMLVLHVIACVSEHHLIPGQDFSFPVVTMLPAIVYLVLYLFRICKQSKSEK